MIYKENFEKKKKSEKYIENYEEIDNIERKEWKKIKIRKNI